MPFLVHCALTSTLVIFMGLSLSAQSAAALSQNMPAHSSGYMVITAHPHASNATVGILNLGDHIIDGAITAQLISSLVEPPSSDKEN